MIDKGLWLSIYFYNILMDGLCKLGMLFDVNVIVGLMKRNGVVLDFVIYGCFLYGYCSVGKVDVVKSLL